MWANMKFLPKFKSLYKAHLCQPEVSYWLLNKEAYRRMLIIQWRKGYFDPVEM